jgi:DNA-binding transcriptional ArsR family regulator
MRSDPLTAVFSALADPTRRAILARLAEGEAAVGELARPFAMSLPAVSKHLSVLTRAGLISREKDGAWRRCRLEPTALEDAAEWIDATRRFWDASLDRLARHLDTTRRRQSTKESRHGKRSAKARKRD